MCVSNIFTARVCAATMICLLFSHFVCLFGVFSFVFCFILFFVFLLFFYSLMVKLKSCVIVDDGGHDCRTPRE